MDDPTSTELPKLRRAALGLALVAAVLVSAGVTIEKDAALPVLGLKVRLDRADLIPLAVVVAGLYCAVRYFYYGFMATPSPHRRRRALLERMRPVGGYLFGSQRMRSLRYSGYTDAEGLANGIKQLWPRVLGLAPSAAVEEEPFPYDGTLQDFYFAVSIIPWQCKVAALLEDLDYATPVIAPLAVAVWFWWAP